MPYRSRRRNNRRKTAQSKLKKNHQKMKQPSLSLPPCAAQGEKSCLSKPYPVVDKPCSGDFIEPKKPKTEGTKDQSAFHDEDDQDDDPEDFGYKEIDFSKLSFGICQDSEDENEVEGDHTSEDSVFDPNNQDEDECLEFEVEETQPPASFIPTPFWFSNEDSDQIKVILQSYSAVLKLEEIRKRCIRQPVPFVGRVKRSKVISDTNDFVTLDVVDVYRRSLIAPGKSLPIATTHWMLTTWSNEEGLPSEIQLLKEDNLKKKWDSKIDYETPPSYLLCMPDPYSKTEYDFYVLEEEQDLTYSFQSPNLPIQYDPFLPSGLLPKDDDLGCD